MQADAVRSGVDTTLEHVASCTLNLVSAACDAILRYSEQSGPNAKHLLLDPLKEFIDSGADNYDELRNQMESNRQLLSNAIHNNRERIIIPEFCLKLVSVVEAFINNYCEHCKYQIQMHDNMHELCDLLNSLTREFCALTRTSNEAAAIDQLLRVCWKDEHSEMAWHIYDNIHDNRLFMKAVINNMLHSIM